MVSGRNEAFSWIGAGGLLLRVSGMVCSLMLTCTVTNGTLPPTCQKWTEKASAFPPVITDVASRFRPLDPISSDRASRFWLRQSDRGPGRTAGRLSLWRRSREGRKYINWQS